MIPPQKKLSEFFKEKYGKDLPKNNSIPSVIQTDIQKQKPLSREEKQEQKKFVDTMMYGLTAPIVFGSSQWASMFPKDMLERAKMMRLAKAIECMDSEMCTWLDTVAWFYPLSMDAPLRHEYYKMYLHSYKNGLPDKWKLLIESDPDIARDADLHENEVQELNSIRRKIFRRQIDWVKNQ